ncbi:MAG: hypothetical protein UR68_C0019G0005 [Candidatus Roizmanbacteria bacterium GW2011_GWA2_35_19]|uniref:Uncharacterized protein n=1 Tax=Candidatus Roizmanbacteria bacterium GW2011_GWA2_35_19 TaxID=1618478 RepID=A0A0G0EAC8_9BACT|nr:MAG: hypothetical protein UR68_C0019G0005 [Candidatus Roizmanbacteria bacterium GW2011_GWA2_35_19]
MKKIKEDKIEMKPKIYFVLGSLITFVSLIFSFISSVFFLNLIKFILRSHGPMGKIRFEQLLSSFPWWAPLMAIIGLIVGIWLLKKYDFSYKNNFVVITIGFLVAVIIGAWLIDLSGLNNIWFRQGPMKGIMKKYLQDNNLQDTKIRKFRNRLN